MRCIGSTLPNEKVQLCAITSGNACASAPVHHLHVLYTPYMAVSTCICMQGNDPFILLISIAKTTSINWKKLIA